MDDRSKIISFLNGFDACIVIPVLLEVLQAYAVSTVTKVDDYVVGILSNVFHIVFPSCFDRGKES